MVRPYSRAQLFTGHVVERISPENFRDGPTLFQRLVCLICNLSNCQPQPTLRSIVLCSIYLCLINYWKLDLLVHHQWIGVRQVDLEWIFFSPLPWISQFHYIHLIKQPFFFSYEKVLSMFGTQWDYLALHTDPPIIKVLKLLCRYEKTRESHSAFSRPPGHAGLIRFSVYRPDESDCGKVI